MRLTKTKNQSFAVFGIGSTSDPDIGKAATCHTERRKTKTEEAIAFISISIFGRHHVRKVGGPLISSAKRYFAIR